MFIVCKTQFCELNNFKTTLTQDFCVWQEELLGILKTTFSVIS